MTITVQNWAAGKLANDGFLLYLTSRPTAVHLFSSREGQTAPLLTIEYSLPPTDTPTVTATATATQTSTPTSTATATPTTTATPTATSTAVPGQPAPDLGEAPDSTNHLGAVMEAYPGVTAGFPTVYDRGPNALHGPLHLNQPPTYRLGQAITTESEADQGPDADVINNIIAKTVKSFHLIKSHPIGFLRHILMAIKEGFIKFFDNILTHLINGLVGWLDGA